jgi:hypothetical protein
MGQISVALQTLQRVSTWTFLWFDLHYLVQVQCTTTKVLQQKKMNV